MRREAVKGVGWAGMSQVYRQILQLVTLTVLAKMLEPADFGLLAMCTVVTRFMDLFKDLGTSAAIIQKEDVSTTLLSTVFWTNAGLGLLMALLLFVASPAVALVYGESRIVPLLQTLALGFILAGLGSTFKAKLEKTLEFRSVGITEVAGITAGSITAVIMAFQGGGVWSLVALSLVASGTTSLALWLLSRWKPAFVFRWQEVRDILGFSLNYMGYNVFNYLSRNADYFLIGRFLGVQALGYYTMAYQIVVYPVKNITGVVSRVMFPVLTKMQNDTGKMAAVYLRIIGSIALITFPLMFGLWALAEPFVLIFLGEQWLPAIPVILILSPIGVSQSIGSTVGPLYLAKGKTGWMFGWGITSSALVLTAFVVGLQWGITGVAWSYLFATLSLHYFNFRIPLGLIELRVLDVYKTLTPAFVCATLMLIFLIALLSLAPENIHWWTFAGMIAAGASIYGIGSWYLNRTQLIGVFHLLSNR